MKSIILFGIILIGITGCTSIDQASFLLLCERVKALENQSKQVTKELTVKEDSVIVWISNSNGSTTPIKLIIKDGRYIGPRGEYYITQPTQRIIEKTYGF